MGKKWVECRNCERLTNKIHGYFFLNKEGIRTKILLCPTCFWTPKKVFDKILEKWCEKRKNLQLTNT